VYEDRTLSCRDCTDSFIFSGGEQRFFAEKGLVNIPQRCPNCRANAKRVRMGGPRDYHAAVCNACGNQAMVPFAPARVLQQLLRQGPRRGDYARRRAGLVLIHRPGVYTVSA